MDCRMVQSRRLRDASAEFVTSEVWKARSVEVPNSAGRTRGPVRYLHFSLDAPRITVQQQDGRTAAADHIRNIDAADFSRAAREFFEHGANYPLSTADGEQAELARAVGRRKADTLPSLTQATVGKRDAVKI
jgi:hypothetical protein